RSSVSLAELLLADSRKLVIGGIVPVREVGAAVAELLGQVELEPLGELVGSRDRVQVVREAVAHLGRRQQHALPVAAALLLAGLERGAVADRDERVLEHGARSSV